VDVPPVAFILKTLDMAATLDWYQRIGFEVRDVQPKSAPTGAELARDGPAS
jgi:hypothetical protein